MTSLRLTVNGSARTIDAAPFRPLLDVLRDDLALTGAKECCAVGECGACTVLMNGVTVNACLVLAGEADGADVVTVEGLADEDGAPNRLQRAFVDHGAVQCGFCIPGMVMSAQNLLDTDPQPDEATIREALSGNLCRCAGYNRIIAAVQAAATLDPDPSDGHDAERGSSGAAHEDAVEAHVAGGQVDQ